MESKVVLSKIQKSLRAPKNQYNRFGNYSYRSCEDILEAVKPLLPEGYSVILSDEIVEIAGRFYVKAKASLVGNGEEVSTVAFAREPESRKGMDDAQVTGATSSYARKYALNGLFAIDDEKDADTRDNRENSQEIQQQQESRLDALVTEAQKKVLEANGLYREGMTKKEAIEVIRGIKERVQ